MSRSKSTATQGILRGLWRSGEHFCAWQPGLHSGLWAGTGAAEGSQGSPGLLCSKDIFGRELEPILRMWRHKAEVWFCVLCRLQVVGSSLDEMYFSSCFSVCGVSFHYHSSPMHKHERKRDIGGHVCAGLLVLVTRMLFSCLWGISLHSPPPQSNMYGCEDGNTEPTTEY